MINGDREKHFLEAEHFVEAQSAELKKELRLGDLVLSQLAYIVGLQWIGVAGKLGPAHIMYWIPAVLLFYIPSGMVVVHLNREMPLEGGLYQWAKLRFGDLTGFLVALNIWATLVLILSSQVSQITDCLAYAVGPSAAWIVENKFFTTAVGAALVVGLILVALRGLALAKWFHNVAGFGILVLLVPMIALAIPRWLHGGAVVAPAALTFPAVSLMNLNILGRMGFGAFCGFDGCAIFSGEVRNPRVARTIRRSILMAAPLIALFYIAGTACALAFTRPADIDLILPTMQVLSRGAQTTPIAFLVTPLVAILIIGNLLGGSSLYNNALVRLPMVAGWDHLLPAWFSRLHPRFRTPVGSILFIGATILVLTVLGSVGTGAQEAFQLLNSAGLICWAFTYLVMFAIPLIARGEKPSWKLRAAALSGFGMTLLYALLAAFPIVDVANPLAFTVKISGIVIAINAGGVWYFRRASRQREALAATA